MKLVLLVALCCLAIHSGHGAPRTAVYNYVKCNPNGDQANCVTFQSPKMPWSADLPDKLPASEAQFLEGKAVEDEELDEVKNDEPLEEEEAEEEEEEMMQDEDDEDDEDLEDDDEEESIGNEYEDEMRVQEEDEDEDEDEDEEEEEEEEGYEEEEDEEDDDMLVGEQNENTGLEEEEEDKMPLLGEEGESPATFFSELGSGSEEGSGSDVTDRLFEPFGGDVGSGDSLNGEPNPAARNVPSLRDILQMPARMMKKAAEKELIDDHLLKQ